MFWYKKVRILIVGGNYFRHIMVDTTIQDKLSRLGYSQFWLDSGVLTNEQLEEQIKQLDTGEDNNTEHYRYRTLTDYFSKQTSFEDDLLKEVLRLLQSDSDKTMAGSATLNLLKQSGLNDQQFGTVAGFLQTFGAWTTKQIDRVQEHRTKQ